MIRLKTIIISVAVALGAPACADPGLQRPVLRFNQPVRIALPDFVAADPSETELARHVSQTIASDLMQVGVFELVDPVALLHKTVNVDAPPEFTDWRRTSTRQLVVGRIDRQPNDRVKVEFRLWDISSGTQLTGKQYIGSPGDVVGIGHLISGDIYQSTTHDEHTFR